MPPRLRRRNGSSTKPSRTAAIRTQRISMPQEFQTPPTIAQPARRPVQTSRTGPNVLWKTPPPAAPNAWGQPCRAASRSPSSVIGLPGGLPSEPMSDRHISQHFEPLAIHAGNTADPVTGAVVPPIYQVSTYKQDGVRGLRGGYEDSRSANPTRTPLEENLAALEAGPRSLPF